MAPRVAGPGYDWTFGQTEKALRELVDLVRPGGGGQGDLLAERVEPPPVQVRCKSADALDHLEDGSVDLVVMDPLYYDNVMYAELSDFFSVWLKRTARLVFPDLFRMRLTDKEREAVANPARFRSERGARERAHADYRERMPPCVPASGAARADRAPADRPGRVGAPSARGSGAPRCRGAPRHGPVEAAPRGRAPPGPRVCPHRLPAPRGE